MLPLPGIYLKRMCSGSRELKLVLKVCLCVRLGPQIAHLSALYLAN